MHRTFVQNIEWYESLSALQQWPTHVHSDYNESSQVESSGFVVISTLYIIDSEIKRCLMLLKGTLKEQYVNILGALCCLGGELQTK